MMNISAFVTFCYDVPILYYFPLVGLIGNVDFVNTVIVIHTIYGHVTANTLAALGAGPNPIGPAHSVDLP